VVDRGLAQNQVDLGRACNYCRTTATVKDGIRLSRHLWKSHDSTTPGYRVRLVNVTAGLQQPVRRLAGIC